jgi:hypothetical protein
MKTIFQTEEAARVIFHYNRKHNEDSSIPTWVIKHKGQTYYVNHLESEVGFKTKETPDNEHTKGSLQFFGKLKIEEENGTVTAYIS